MGDGATTAIGARVPDPRPARGAGRPRPDHTRRAASARVARSAASARRSRRADGAARRRALRGGASPTATASLQNAVVALRKALGPDVLVTRPPGYLLAVAPDQIDARRFEQVLADARRASVTERRDLLVRALGLWRGPRSPSSPSRSGRRPRPVVSKSCVSSPLEERIATDVELGRRSGGRPELQSLVDEHPLRERLRELLMLALYRAGRQAEALSAYTDARAALDELGIEPGEGLQRLQAAILRHEAGLSKGQRQRRPRLRRGDRQGARRRPRRPRARPRRRG